MFLQKITTTGKNRAAIVIFNSYRHVAGDSFTGWLVFAAVFASQIDLCLATAAPVSPVSVARLASRDTSNSRPARRRGVR